MEFKSSKSYFKCTLSLSLRSWLWLTSSSTHHSMSCTKPLIKSFCRNPSLTPEFCCFSTTSKRTSCQHRSTIWCTKSWWPLHPTSQMKVLFSLSKSLLLTGFKSKIRKRYLSVCCRDYQKTKFGTARSYFELCLRLMLRTQNTSTTFSNFSIRCFNQEFAKVWGQIQTVLIRGIIWSLVWRFLL